MNWWKAIRDRWRQNGSESLYAFFPLEQMNKVRSLPRVAVMPFYLGKGADEDWALGLGLSWLLMRDLSLLPSWSMLGPEDTPITEPDLFQPVKDDLLTRQDVVLSGAVSRTKNTLRIETWVYLREQRDPIALVTDGSLANLDELWMRLDEGIAKRLGQPVSAKTRLRWQVGRPADLRSLRRLGELIYEFGEARDRCDFSAANPRAAVTLMKEDGLFGLPALTLSRGQMTDAELQNWIREAVRRDHCNPFLNFELFCALWKDSGEAEPHAAKWLKEALMLAPGHGKAHMLLSRAMPRQTTLFQARALAHAEAAYALLPGNSFAISNYAEALEEMGDPHLGTATLRDLDPETQSLMDERLMALYREMVEHDPDNPHGYFRLAGLLDDNGEPEEAYLIAQRLERLLMPPVSSRTRYCMEQNPDYRAMLSRRDFEPHIVVWELLADLCIRLDRMSEAFDYVMRILDQDPANATALSMREHFVAF